MADQDVFNEKKKRELVYFLLENDVGIYKALIPEIKSLNSEAFENLFLGNTEYKYEIKKQKVFLRLVKKFDNFYAKFEDWYKEQKYHQYMKILWLNYPCIESLKNLEEKKLEELLNSFNIDYSSWPLEIKKDFKSHINSTIDTEIFSDIMMNNFNDISCLLKQLNEFSDAINKEKDCHLYKINSLKLSDDIFASLLSLGGSAFPIGKFLGERAIKNKEFSLVNEMIKQNSNYDEKTAKTLTKEFIKLIKEQKVDGNYNYVDKFSQLHELNAKCKNGNLAQLNLNGKVNAVFHSKLFCTVNVALSFLNLGWSIYELNETYKSFEKLKEYKSRLETIKSNFNIHKQQIGILPEDPLESIEKIGKILGLIREDQNDLTKLIKNIMDSLETQMERKSKSVGGLAASIGLGTLSIIGGLSTGNALSISYGLSTIANFFSAGIHIANIETSANIIKELKKILDEAIQLENEIKNEVDTLIKEIIDRKKQLPKFDI